MQTIEVFKIHNRYGEWIYAKLAWKKGKKRKTKLLGAVNKQEPTYLLDVCLEATDRLNTDELCFLRDANKVARWV